MKSRASASHIPTKQTSIPGATLKGMLREIVALSPLTDSVRREAVMDAVNALKLDQTEAWAALERLSPDTVVDTIDAVPEGIFEVGPKKFTTVATAYVRVHHNNDLPPDTNSFPMVISGHFGPRGKAIVDTASIDTSSFYA